MLPFRNVLQNAYDIDYAILYYTILYYVLQVHRTEDPVEECSDSESASRLPQVQEAGLSPSKPRSHQRAADFWGIRLKGDILFP